MTQGYNYRNFLKGQKAVALGYDKEKDMAPRILMSGAGSMAEKILAVAREHNIPIHKDAKLADVLSVLEINSYIPIEVYSVVAEILSYIYTKNQEKQNVK